MLPLGSRSTQVETADLRAGNPALETATAMLELAKPGVAGLVVVTMLCGALTAPGSVRLSHLVLALFGTASVVAAANALNMIWERETDALMRRTRTRPLPTGRLSKELALAFALFMAVLGTVILFAFVGELAAVLTLMALVSYVFAYTPLKRVTPLALFVGAVPGAIPPLVGWASVTGSLDTLAWVMFGILYVWQLPHFLAIAIFRRDEYQRAGHRVLPVVHGIRRTKLEMLAYSLLLVFVSLMPVGLGLASAPYAVVALVAGLSFLWLTSAGLTVKDDARWARRVFFASMPYLVFVLGALAVFSAF